MFEPLQPIVVFHPKSTKAKKRKSACTCFGPPFFSFELLLAPSFSLPLLELLLSHRPSALVKRAISLQQARKKSNDHQLTNRGLQKPIPS